MLSWLAKEAAKRGGGKVASTVVKAVKSFGSAVTKRSPKPTTVTRSTTPTRVTTPPRVTPKPVTTTRPLTRADVRSKIATEGEYAMDRAARQAAREAARAKKAADTARKAKPTTPAKPTTKAPAKTPAKAPKPEAPVTTTTPPRPRFRPTVRGTVETVGALAPLGVAGAEAAGIDVPTPIEYAADAASVLSGASLLQRGFGPNSFLNSAVRNSFKNKNLWGKAGDLATKVIFPAFGAQQILTSSKNFIDRLGNGSQAEAVTPEVEDVQVIPPSLIPTEPVLEDGGLSPEEQYLSEVQTAIDTLLADAQKQADAEMAAIDAQYNDEIAAIQADYDSRKEQVSSNYAAAIDQIGKYQLQADQLLSSAAAAAQAGYEQAAGGLQNVQVPTGMTAGEAALSGISPTALGGAAISGAALSRGLAGAEQAAAAAQRFSAGVDLGGQLAETRLSEADTLAALERGLLESKTLAAQNRSDLKAAARKAQAAVKSEAVRLNADTKIAIADKVAQMTPAQLAAWKQTAASKQTYQTPSWFGKNVSGPSDTVIPKVKTATYPATVGTLNTALDMVSAALTDPEYRDPSTALAAWTLFFAELDPDYKAMLRYKGVPDQAGAMYAALFKAAPSK